MLSHGFGAISDRTSTIVPSRQLAAVYNQGWGWISSMTKSEGKKVELDSLPGMFDVRHYW
jgi:hypothetical protein